MKFTGFVPVRLNSKRVPRKSICKIGYKTLISRCISTLGSIGKIDNVILYCSTPLDKYIEYSRYRYIKRDKKLDSDETTFNEVMDSIIYSIETDYIVFMSCTSPFIKPETIGDMISKIETKKYDSSFTATSHNTFAWYNHKPLNYNPSNVPKTQNIKPILLETSGLYIFLKKDYLRTHRRIGIRPYIKIVDLFEGWDIDTPREYKMAKLIYKMGVE
jgi:CMP-N-acetylneuraminic acid synthetase